MDRMFPRVQVAQWNATPRRSLASDQPSGRPPTATWATAPQRAQVRASSVLTSSTVPAPCDA